MAVKKAMTSMHGKDIEAEVAAVIKSNQHKATAPNATQFFNSKHSKVISCIFIIAF
jgi:hypothetical protein